MPNVTIKNERGEVVSGRSVVNSESIMLVAMNYILDNQLGALSINWYIRDERLRVYTGLLQPTGPRKRNEYNPTGDYVEFSVE